MRTSPRWELGCILLIGGLGLAACDEGTIVVVTPPDAAVDGRPPEDPDFHDAGAVVDRCGLELGAPDLPHPMIALVGGSAGPTGSARDGGAVSMISDGAIRLDPTAAFPAWPTTPPPDGGRVIGGGELGADLVDSGTLRLVGFAATHGGDPVRTIRSTAGDILISGTLRAGRHGAATQSLVIDAPMGTVLVTGNVVTTPGGDAIDGHDAGAITIHARQVIVEGSLMAHGACGDHEGGDGGAIALVASDALRVAGPVDTSGGDAGPVAPARGGAGGGLRLAAGGEVQLRAAVRIRGGAGHADADAIGGDAGDVRIDAGGFVGVAGALDARGGLAMGEVGGTGGAAGELAIGATTRPAEIVLSNPLSADGGAGGAAGGHGGPVTIEPRGGDLVVAAALDTNGGASRLAPGRGGALLVRVGPAAGGIRIAAPVRGAGGDATDASVAIAGGDAAPVEIRVLTHEGDLRIEQTGELAFGGGASSGAARAGGGAPIDIYTRDGTFSLAGRISARGGDAPYPGGTGGDGGPLYVHTDTDFDGIGGAQTIEPSGRIDVSGGAGAHGGSARNNGESGVAYFPEDRDQIAVLLNSDTAPGELEDGEIQNLGVIVARGASSGGWGGDVIFHGRQPAGDIDPVPGEVLADGDGDGADGSVSMQ